jgi:hypothetical protein
MRHIYKFPLQTWVGSPQQISLMKGSKFLNFRFQQGTFFGEQPAMWFLVPSIHEVAPSNDMEIRTFILRFTGDTSHDNETYLGMEFDHNGLVYHLFEITNES